MPGPFLIEAVVAAGVVGSAALALAHLLALSGTVNSASRHATAATLLAAQKAEEILASRDLPAVDSMDYVDRWGRPSGADGGPPGDAVYVRRWRFADVAGSSIGSRRVEVEVLPLRAAAPGAAARRESARLVFLLQDGR